MTTPSNKREVFTEDLTFCGFHPGVASIGWRDVHGEDGSVSTVGVCMECAATIGGETVGAQLVPISAGSPCRCGPGFCASKRGLGFFGFCGGSRTTTAPPCPRCGAGDQSGDGCWLCRETEVYEGARDNDKAWARLWAAGVSGDEAFNELDRSPGMTWVEAVDAAVKKKVRDA